MRPRSSKLSVLRAIVRKVRPSRVRDDQQPANPIAKMQELLSLAVELHLGGRLNEALFHYDELLPLARSYALPNELAKTLMNRAGCLDDLERHGEAAEVFDEALGLYRTYGEPADVAECLMNRSVCLNKLGRQEDALSGYDEAIPWFRDYAPAAELALFWANRATCLRSLGRMRDALVDFEEALTLYRECGAPSTLADCLLVVASCRKDLGLNREAVEGYDEAESFFRKHGKLQDLAACLSNRSLCLVDLGHHEDAITGYHEALALFRRHGKPSDVGACLTNLAGCLSELRQHQIALSHYSEALGLFRKYGSMERLGRCLTNRANCLFDIGHWVEALADYDEALPIARKYGQHDDVFRCVGNRANCLHELGWWEKALAGYDEALAIILDDGAPQEIAASQMNRAGCLGDLGWWDDALKGYDMALALYRELDEPTSIAQCLANRSDCLDHLGRREAAMEGLDEALGLFRAHNNRSGLAACLMSSANCLNKLGQREESLKEFDEALELYREHCDRSSLAGCIMNRAICLSDLERWDAAREGFDEALVHFRDLGIPSNLATCLMNRALCLASHGQHEEALDGFDEGFAMEDRASAFLQNPTHRVLAREQTVDRYQLTTYLALQLNQAERAWGYIQRGKSRTLTDLLSVRGELTMLDRQEFVLAQRRDAAHISQEAFRLGMDHIQEQRLIQREARFGHDARVPLTLEDVAAALQPGEALIDTFALDDEGSLAFFCLRHDQPAVVWVSVIEGSVLMPLVLRWNEARSDWTRAMDAIAKSHKQFPGTNPGIVSRRDRFIAERGYYVTRDDAAAAEQQVLADLGNLIIAPVVELLDDTVSTLIMSPDGLLHQLPLAAVTLNDADENLQPLTERFDLQLVPTASSLAILRSQNPRVTWPMTLLAAAPFARKETQSIQTVPSPSSTLPDVLADDTGDGSVMDPNHLPTHDRARGQGVRRDLSRRDVDPDELPESGPEISSIAALLTLANHSAPLTLKREEATRPRLIDELAVARILHLATHGGELKDGESIIDYRILLAANTEIRVRELYDGDVKLTDVFLVTLSACSLGQVMLKGAEASGFVQAFLQAGAGVVLAPLWAVYDLPTRLLMERFYKELTAESRPTIATAWRRACHWLRTRTDYGHPVYWAGFLPSGDAAIRLIA